MKMLVLGLAILFVLIATIPLMDSALAQSAEPMPDSEEKDGEYDEKICPFKNKTASIIIGQNI